MQAAPLREMLANATEWEQRAAAPLALLDSALRVHPVVTSPGHHQGAGASAAATPARGPPSAHGEGGGGASADASEQGGASAGAVTATVSPLLPVGAFSAASPGGTYWLSVCCVVGARAHFFVVRMCA